MVVKWNQVHRLGYTKQQTFAGAHCIIVQCTCFWCCLYLVYFQPIVAAFEIPPLRRISSPAPSFILRSVNVTLALVQFIFSCFMIVIFYLFGMLLSSNLPTFILFPPNFSSFGALLWFLSQFSSEFFFFHVHKPHMKKNIPRYIEASKKKWKMQWKQLWFIFEIVCLTMVELDAFVPSRSSYNFLYRSSFSLHFVL